MKREMITTLAVDGEKEYKKSLEDAARQMRVLGSESKAVTAAFGKNANSVSALTAKNSILNKQIEQQEAVVSSLKQAVEESASMFGEADSKTDGYRIKLNNAEAALANMNAELQDNREALYDAAIAEGKTANEAETLGGSLRKSNSETLSFKDQIKDFASSSIGQFASITGAVALAAKALKSLWDNFEEAGDWADELLTLSAQTGITTKTLQKLEYASRFVDVEMEDMQKGMAKVVKAFEEAQAAGSDYIEIADGVTISTKDANDQVKSSEQLFYDAVDALGSMANETEREAAAQELFGKSYQDIMPLIKAGSSALKKYGEEAEDIGVILEDGLVIALGKLDDAMEKSAAQAESTSRRTAAALSSAGIGMAGLQRFISNPLQEAMNFSYEYGRMMNATLHGLTKSDMDMVETLEIGANAAGLTFDEFTKKVSDMATMLLVSSDGAMSFAEAQDKAYGLVVQGIDEATYATNTMAAAQANYDEIVQAAYDNYAALAQQYADQVQATATEYLSAMGGIFGTFPQMVKTSGEELIAQQESQNAGMTQWMDNLAKLTESGLDEGIIQKLKDLGPQYAGQVAALAEMTPEQLAQWEALYSSNMTLAEQAAEDALQPMKDQVLAALDEAQQAVSDRESALYDLGIKLGQGVGSGFAGSTDYIKTEFIDAIQAAIDSAEEEFEIHSPSDYTGDALGEPMALGVIERWNQTIKTGTQGMVDSLVTSADRLRSAAVTDNGQLGGAKTYAPTTTRVIHGGTIRVEGIDDAGQMEAVYDLIVDRVLQEARL